MFKKSILSLIVSAALASQLVACGGGGGSPETQAKASDTQSGNTAQAGKASTLTLTDPANATASVTVVVPADAVAEGQVQIAMTFEDKPPGALLPEAVAAGGAIVSKTLVLTKNRPGTFDEALTVTMPYDVGRLDAGDVPSVLFWDEADGSYQAMAVVDFDAAKGTVTFKTAHFSKFIVAAVKGLGAQVAGSPSAPGRLDVDTGFRPSTDAFFHANISSYSSPGGNCLGMASYADWFYEQAKAKLNGGVGLFDTYRDGIKILQDDDFRARELIARAHAAASQDWAGRLMQRWSQLGQEATATSVIQAMKLTLKPQLFLLHGNPSWWESFVLGKSSWGHALLAYRYSATDGVIYLYDPNQRGDDAIGVKYSPGQGFQGMNKADLLPTEPDLYAFDSVGSIYSPSDMRALFDGAAGGWDEGRYGKITLTSHVMDTATRTVTISDRQNVRLVGTVQAKLGETGNEPNTVDVYVAGSKVGSYPLKNGGFDIAMPTLPDAPSTEVLMMAHCANCNPVVNGQVGARKKSIYDTFSRFKFALSSNNLGFEKGNFDMWTSVRRLWGGGSVVTPSDKSTVVDAGTDPIATSISTVLFGQHAARINNQDNSYHISTLERDVMVPSDQSNFTLAFNWAAVLEDPKHSAKDQPYVSVEVTHPASGEVLYQRRFYAADPSFLGWKPFMGGNWKAIDWQSVRLNGLERFKGQALHIKVEAADCALGGHGGYAYLDAEE